MKEIKTKAWDFLATALASTEEPADLNFISKAADRVNNVVATVEELKISLKWLLDEKLISEDNAKFTWQKKK